MLVVTQAVKGRIVGRQNVTGGADGSVPIDVQSQQAIRRFRGPERVKVTGEATGA
jgi:hypothetical protein